MKNMINVMKERIPSSMQYDGKIDQMKIKQIAIIPVETHCTLYIHACKVDGEKFAVQFIHAVKSGNKMTDGTLTMQRVKAQEINVIVNDEVNNPRLKTGAFPVSSRESPGFTRPSR
jgi:hypothetical protein